MSKARSDRAASSKPARKLDPSWKEGTGFFVKPGSVADKPLGTTPTPGVTPPAAPEDSTFIARKPAERTHLSGS